MRKLPTWICIVIVYQSNSQHRRSHLRPYGQNTLRVISHQRYCDVFRSFFRGQNHLRSSTCPKLLSQCLCQTITITYTNPVYQGPPSRPASPEPRTPTEPFEPADPTVTTKAKPPPPKYSPGEAGNYFPSRPPSRQHAYKTPPETQPVYTANPSPQATPIRPNPRGNPPRQYGPNQPFSPRGQYYQQAPSQPFTPFAASSSRDMPFGPASTPPKVRASAPYAPAPRPPKFWAKGPSTQQTSPLPEQPPSRLLSIQNYQQFASLTAICL